MLKYESLVEMFIEKSLLTDKGITFINRRIDTFVSYHSLYQKSLRLLYSLQEMGVNVGDEAILQIDDNEEFISIFWACILGGIIPVPLSNNNDIESKNKTLKVWEVLKNPYLITNRNPCLKSNSNDLDNLKEGPNIESRIINVEKIKITQDIGTVVNACQNDIAFIQFSSGSTGEPKGVTLTHENLLYNVSDISKSSKMSPDDIGLNWMPLTHDMGLIGFHITLMFLGAKQYVMPTRMFIREPIKWMEKASYYKANQLYSPNFGYSYFLSFYNKVTSVESLDWDLSSVNVIFNGAEPISVELCEEFLNKMGRHSLNSNVMYPVYGLAEASVAVSFPIVKENIIVYNLDRRNLKVGEKIIEVSKDNKENISFVDVGFPLRNCKVRICDNNNMTVEDDVVGFIQISGGNVTSGYYNNTIATDQAVTEDGWMRTGDLGFMRNGRLVITGRDKDIIFINGQNYYPHDIERVTQKSEFVDLGRVAACGIYNSLDHTENIILFIQYRKKIKEFISISNEVKELVYNNLGINIKYVIPIKKLPKTTSGKIQRHKLKDRYVEGEFSSIIKELNELQYEQNSKKLLPLNTTEESVCNLIKDILEIETLDIYDNLSLLGINSITTMQILFKIGQKYKVDISIKEFSNIRNVAELASLITNSELSSNHQGIEMKTANIEEFYEPFDLTEVQFAYLMGREESFEIGGISTHLYFDIMARLDLKRFNNVLQKIIERHPSLRTTILPDGRQKVLHEVPTYTIKTLDISGLNHNEQTVFLKNERDRMSHHIFQVDTWPLFEFKAIKVSDGNYYLLIGFDLLIADGESINIIGNELVSLYKDPGLELSELNFSFRDYVLAVKEMRHTNYYEKSKSYWLGKLDNFPSYPQIPFLNNPANISKVRFKRKSKHINEEVWKKIQNVCRERKITPSILLCALYAEVLSYWSNQQKLGISLTLSNRLPFHKDVDNLVGDFTSLILLDLDFSKDKTILERVNTVSNTINSALEYRYYDGIEFLRELASKKGTVKKASMPFVFTSMISSNKKNAWSEIGEINYIITQTPQVFLDCQISENKNGLSVTWDFVEELFNDEIIDAMFEHYVNIINDITVPNKRVELKPNETDLNLISEYNNTKVMMNPTTLHSMFEKQVNITPNKSAIVLGDKSITYKELDEKSNKVANYLRHIGISRNDLVAVDAERIIETVINILGILKAGAGYVPIDSAYPKERVDYIVKNSNCRTLLDKNIYGEISVSDYSNDSLLNINSPEDIAYVIYTSGSTGTPKGVVINHSSVTNTIRDINNRFSVNYKDQVLGLSSICFDLSVYDIFGSLSTGATLFMVPDQRDVSNIIEIIRENNITIWNSVPAIMDIVIKSSEFIDKNLRLVMLSGDWIPTTLPKKISKQFVNSTTIGLGGATEASIWSIFYPIEHKKVFDKSIPYGYPLANQSVYILNYNLELCPIDVPGEIYIGGVGLANEYIGDKDKTNKSFIKHPTLGRIYKTGDYGRLDREGFIEFLGREDQQVKIQGYRVELGEIESVIEQYPAIDKALVSVTDNAKGSKQLTAYVTSKLAHDKYFNVEEEESFNARVSLDALVEAGMNQSRKIPEKLQSGDYIAFSEILENICTGYIYNSISELIETPVEGRLININEIILSNKIKLIYKKLIYQWLEVLVEDNILLKNNEEEFIFKRSIPVIDIESLWVELEQCFAYSEWNNAIIYLKLCSENILSILKGSVNPLNLLFPEGKWDRAENIYRYNQIAIYYNNIVKEGIKAIVDTIPPERKIRILEFGAGTGGTTASILPILTNRNIEYVYTDISDYFTENAKKMFEDYQFINYKLLDIDKSPESQGFEANSFDIIIGANVLHDARNLEKTMGYLKSLLKPAGYLAILELVSSTRWQKVTIGFIEGFSNYEDYRLENQTPLLNVGQWKEVSLKNGYEEFISFPQDKFSHGFFEQGVMFIRAPKKVKKINKPLLKQFLETKLPDYMIPNTIFELDTFPLTSNGKLDRNGLPSPFVMKNQVNSEYIAPRNTIEKKLTEIWQDVLGISEVGIKDNYYSLGGDSLKAIRIAAKAKSLNIDITWRDIYNHLTIDEILRTKGDMYQKQIKIRKKIEEMILNVATNNISIKDKNQKAVLSNKLIKFELEVIRKSVDDLFGYLDLDQMKLRESTSLEDIVNYLSSLEYENYSRIHPKERKGDYPISAVQKRMIVIDQLEGIGTTYNVPLALKIKGSLDIIKSKRIFDIICKRHEILRTSFRVINGEYFQTIHPNCQIEFSFEELEKNEISSTVEKFIEPFDITKPSLFRVKIIKYKTDEYILLIDLHHIISDGTSLKLILKEFADLYEDKELPSLPIQYSDYSIWLNNFKKTVTCKMQEDYWLNQLQGKLPVLDMPTDYPRPTNQTFSGERINFNLSDNIVSKMMNFKNEFNMTTYVMILAAYNILLSKYTSQEEIIVGTPVSGRTHLETENSIGMFVNTLLLRNYPSGDKTIKEFLNEIKETVSSAFDNQEYQFDWLVEALGVKSDKNRNMLFDAMLSVQNSEMFNLNIPGLLAIPDNINTHSSKVDLELIVIEKEDKIDFSFEYNTNLFKAETIRRLIKHFENVINEMVNNVDGKLIDFKIITDLELKQIINKFNNTYLDYDENLGIHQLIYEQVEKDPYKVAVVNKGVSITYLDIEKRANHLAKLLTKRGICNGSLVGLVLTRSIDMLVAILGVLKAGGAYVPIDPSYPIDRIKFILEDSRTSLLITNLDNLEYNVPILNVNKISDSNNMELDYLENENKSYKNKLAYIIYTSGSTGRPKGVEIEHQSIINLFKGISQSVDFSKNKNILSLTSCAFDIFVLETLFPLSKGMTVFLADEEEQEDPNLISEILIKNNIKILQLTPSRARMLINNISKEAFKKISDVLIGGEEISGNLLEEIRLRTNAKIYNMYGPTETTVWSTIKELTWENGITIGSPIANTFTYILDENKNMLPIGIIGELYISGHGVARGYVNSNLSKGSFQPDPYVKGMRMYKTGDLARWTIDGELQYIGRKDRQVKINGNRIEMGEIENHLMMNSTIREAVVLQGSNSFGDKILCAYIVSNKVINKEMIKKQLYKKLPRYMIPSKIIQVDSLPLTANGKLDVVKLKDYTDKYVEKVENLDNMSYLDDTERKLQMIWKDVLSLEKIKVDEDFYELGGHSLKAVDLMHKINKEFRLMIPLKDIIKLHTIKDQAHFINEYIQVVYPELKPIKEKNYYSLSAGQSRIYLMNQKDNNSLRHNMSSVIEVVGDLDIELLETAFSRLIQRHETLRSSFSEIKGEPIQIVQKNVNFKVENLGTTYHNLNDAKSGFIRRFNLKDAPLFRVGFLQTDKAMDKKSFILFDMHHIISDGISIKNIMKEISELCKLKNLPDLPFQYKDYVYWQKQLVKTDLVEEQKEYWIKQLEGYSCTKLLTKSSKDDNWDERNVYKNIDGDLLSKIYKICGKYKVTPSTFFLTLFKLAIKNEIRSEDIGIGLPVSGRSHADLEKLIGVFINTLVIRTKVDQNLKFNEYIKIVMDTVLDAQANQDFQYGNLFEEMKDNYSYQESSLFSIIYNYLPYKGDEIFTIGDTNLKILDIVKTEATADIVLYVMEKEKSLELKISYRSELYEEYIMERILNNIILFIELIVREDKIKISEIFNHINDQEKYLQDFSLELDNDDLI